MAISENDPGVWEFIEWFFVGGWILRPHVLFFVNFSILGRELWDICIIMINLVDDRMELILFTPLKDETDHSRYTAFEFKRK